MIINRPVFPLQAALYFTFLFILLYGCSNIDTKKDQDRFVFSKDIAPIIFKNCTPCHRPGSGAPFDLIAYDDVKKHLHTVQLAVNEKLMPPWPADTGYSHFRDEKVMSASDLNKLNEWISQG